MAKTLTIKYDGKEYLLEYDRKSCTVMESRGFVLDDIDKMPLTMFPMLFQGAFLKHHRMLPVNVIDEIYENIGDRVELLGKLGEMYAENVSSFFDDEENDGKSGKNATWKASF